jgi:hypothetical protein
MNHLTESDRLEILDLCARYYVSTDEADVDGFMDCWIDSDDIVFESAFGTFRGRKAIRDFETAHVTGGMAVGKRHMLSNVIIKPGPEGSALVTSYLTVLEVRDRPEIVATAIYRDSKAVKTKRGWKFATRSMDTDSGYQKWAQAKGIPLGN